MKIRWACDYCGEEITDLLTSKKNKEAQPCPNCGAAGGVHRIAVRVSDLIKAGYIGIQEV